MTDTHQTPDASPESDTDGVGVRRPDQGGSDKPGQAPQGPASGGDGAAGAGGPNGFGTGQ